jgi:hypothetical protein
VDLTVESAAAVRDFYQSVVPWSVVDFDMGGYADYCMNRRADGATVAGICHARGVNSDLPPCWLVYLVVRDLDESMRRCVDLGGRIHTSVHDNGEMGRFCVIQDPAGAYVALLEPPGRTGVDA